MHNQQNANWHHGQQLLNCQNAGAHVILHKEFYVWNLSFIHFMLFFPLIFNVLTLIPMMIRWELIRGDDYKDHFFILEF
jgi:hypothetical protein